LTEQARLDKGLKQAEDWVNAILRIKTTPIPKVFFRVLDCVLEEMQEYEADKEEEEAWAWAGTDGKPMQL
jgi:hypothetical protein